MCKTISDNGVYLRGMRNTFHDKSWFMSIVPFDVDTIVDFGCADGSFLEYMKRNWPEYRYAGIDENEEFLAMTRERGFEAYGNLTEFSKKHSNGDGKVLLVMNSVLHEIYTYKGVPQAEEIWGAFLRNGVKYIALRDMYARGCGIFSSKTEANLLDVCDQKDKHAASNNGELISLHDKLSDFERQWGEVNDGYKLTHFLLKYFYSLNWERELVENYLPFHYRELHEAIRSAGYDITFESFYAIPWLKQKWLSDFDCDTHPALHAFVSKVTTHMKLFLVCGE